MPPLQEIRKKRVCTSCIDELVLKSQVRRGGLREKCSYCGRLRKTFSVSELAEEIDIAFQEHYVRVDDDDDGFGLYAQYALSNDDGLPVVDAIGEAAGITIPIASDIHRVMESGYQSRSAYEIGERTPYDAESHYQRMHPSDRGMREDWDAFGESLPIQLFLNLLGFSESEAG
ncbi:hypothetical protein [Massilia sp. HP4]|uniref:hypothetical protein n=1 Tax=Massilia sp. HP4 TaxID=2562316 RepID=UPI0010C089BB|nr:hypothetical protein [Massilia sp. HP4]